MQAKKIILKIYKIKSASCKIVYYLIKNTPEQNRRHRTEQKTKTS